VEKLQGWPTLSWRLRRDKQPREQAERKKPIVNGKQGQSVHEDLRREEIVKDRDWKVSRVMICVEFKNVIGGGLRG
jgi:hypothetical protein